MDTVDTSTLTVMSFRESSIRLTSQLTKDVKKSQGIFFTPKPARDKVFEILERFDVKPTSVLEPSFGSGEFLVDLHEHYPSATITGVELNQTLYAACEMPNIHNVDFLAYEGQHDLIVGNPPYFVIPKSEHTVECQTNRPNMFVQFLYKAIKENLKDSGVLAFVLPTSLYNSAYYEKMRRYLFGTATILAVEPLDGEYIETQQPTFALVIQKGKRNDDFFLTLNENIYITPHSKELTELLKGSTTLKTLGFEVKTGEVVWNQEKDKLTHDGTLLIYSSNFKDGHVVLGVKEPKKQYITGFHREPLSGKAILINRGYGNASYKLNTVLVDYPSFYAENHVNVVRPVTAKAKRCISAVLVSLNSENTASFIKYFVGNNALSKSEIEGCLPIWLGA
jgi:tRNA1(Val) A37 N6-methylase TrmN6